MRIACLGSEVRERGSAAVPHSTRFEHCCAVSRWCNTTAVPWQWGHRRGSRLTMTATVPFAAVMPATAAAVSVCSADSDVAVQRRGLGAALGRHVLQKRRRNS
jgi:hypothetical protein